MAEEIPEIKDTEIDFTVLLPYECIYYCWYSDRKGLKGIIVKYFGRLLPKAASNNIQWRKWKKNYSGSNIKK